MPLLAYAVGQWAGYKPAPHHWLIADKLEAVARGECRRLMVFMPPRHGKSMEASEFFPAWWLAQNPDRYIIAATYAQDLADDFGRKVRNHCRTPQHHAMFPGFRLKEDSQAASRFHTEQGGVYYGVGVGGPVTGRGAHLLLIDDPIKGREDAESEAKRRQLKDWYTSVARTRLMPGGAIVVIQTRWHEDDLAGWLLRDHAHEQWDVLSLPAIAEEGDPMGRKAGAALWPEAYPLNELEAIRRSIGTRDWTALYQQRPAPVEGGLVKLPWFRRYMTPPAHPRRVIQSWDTAMKAGDVNDPSCGQTWSETETGYYKLDNLTRRMEYPDLKRAILSSAERWNPQSILVEDKASGQSIVQDLRTTTNLPIIPIEPKGDKVVRLLAVSALIESGRVWLPESAPWLMDFEAEVMAFPNGRHDDQVDAMTQALTYLSTGGGGQGLLDYMREMAEASKPKERAS
nr:phage terminase large subunit [Geothrix sp. SG10]